MDGILESIAGEEDLRLLRSGEALPRRPEFFEDHIHFNEAGSGKFAELLAGEMGSENSQPSE